MRGSGIAALALMLGAAVPSARAAAGEVPLRFSFGPGKAAEGWHAVDATMSFATGRGYGFETEATLKGFTSSSQGLLLSSGVAGERAFFFTTRVPAEGNYGVTVRAGHPTRATDLTLKSELRRLMIESLRAAPGEFVTRSFVVNVRSLRISAGNGIQSGVVRLKAPRETTQEAWAWDDFLTLEFNGAAPAVCSVEVEPVNVPTIFLLGDSTVCDQSREPYNSWGQMLPAFFTDAVAIANHGESGETYRDSIGRRRLDKVISVMQPGDWLLMQFGHNDQKQIAAGTGGPFTTYQEEMRQHIAEVRRVGGHPVVVTPMERRAFDADGRFLPSLVDYAAATRAVAQAEGIPCLDLHAMSMVFYEALGPERSPLAFAAPDGKVDNTHHNNYGSYQLARCIVQAIREAKLEIARFISPEVAAFDPAHPDAPETFAVPPSPIVATQRPLGD